MAHGVVTDIPDGRRIMLTPELLWPLMTGAAAVVFGAGRLVEKMRDGRYVTKELCAEHHKREDERWEEIKEALCEIKERMNKIPLAGL